MDNKKKPMTQEEIKAAEQKALKLKNQKEMKQAKSTVKLFLATDAAVKLPEDIIAAMTRICGKVSAGSAQGSVIAKLRGLFPKIGTKVNELEIFKLTKMGRGEIRKKVREALKNSTMAERFWLEFDMPTESWVLLQNGGKQPKGWEGKAIE